MIIPGHPTYQKILDILGASCEQFGTKVPTAEVDKWTKFITRSMSGPYRRFHITNHIFDVAKDGEPTQQIAAFFHDTVYLQIDEKLTSPADQMLSPYVEIKGEKVHFKIAAGNIHVAIVQDVFGVQ